MGVCTFSDEFTSPVPPARLFKAHLDVATLLPKLLPQQVKSIDYIKGNGEPGSILQTTFQDGFPAKQLKRRVEAVDDGNFFSKTSTIEGEGSYGKIEKAVTEVQFVPGPGGGSINKTKTTYHTKGGEVLTEEDVKEGTDWYSTISKAVDAYLLQYPNAYV